MSKLASRGSGRGLKRVFLLATLRALVVTTFASSANALPVSVSVERLTLQDAVVEDIEVTLEDDALEVRARRVRPVTGWHMTELRLDCRGAGWSAQRSCVGASWQFELSPQDGAWQLPLSGSVRAVRWENDSWEVTTGVDAGMISARLDMSGTSADVRGRLSWHDQPVTALAAWPLPESPLGWVLEGSTAGHLVIEHADGHPVTADYRIAADGLGFDSPSGLYAGAGLGLRSEGRVTLAATPVLETSASLSAGELLIGQFYAAFNEVPITLRAEVESHDSRLQVRVLNVSDDRALSLQAVADFDPAAPLETLDYRIDHLDLNFPLAYERYFAPVLAPLSLDGLTVTGQVRWRGSGTGDTFPEGELSVQDLSIVDTGEERFAVTGLDAKLNAGASPTDSHVAWRGLLIRRINLGAGHATVATRPGHFELAQPLWLDVLGGSLAFDRAEVTLPPDDAPAGANPEIKLQASLDGMQMVQLTEALGWPRFEGQISGTIPGVSLEGSVLSVDGRIIFEVFDGSLVLSGLRIERPFGVLPSLAAELDVTQIDLQRLTQTFSFGRISGRLEGYMRDLRMLNWRPVAFDAWFGTPMEPGASKAISRQAVNNLTSIGGGGPTAALTGPLLQLFSNFSYRRLGMGCTLRNNICKLRGLEDDENSVLILEGSGVPKIMIRAYNRRMDFPQLVANLAAASEGEAVRIGNGD